MKYLILGAGPAGLTFAGKMKLKGEDSFLVLEKEEVAGGLCRSEDVDGSPMDIGGGHFLDVKRPHVNEFLFHFMPADEWNSFDRDSRIMVNGRLVNHPLEANLWQMNLEDQVEYLKSVAAAGSNLGTEMPEKFTEWISWKLGARLAQDYMIPYNSKMFGEELNQLGTYWLDKLPDVSFDEILRSCLNRKPYGRQPGHAQFYYPKKYGYGELWRRMADRIKGHMEFKKQVKSIDFFTRTVRTEDGASYQADKIVTTIPWMEYEVFIGMPEELQNDIKKLKFTSVQTEYFPENMNTKAHWIYYPDLKLPYHRILVRHNFCPDSRGYWTETNRERINDKESRGCYKYMNRYAYPLNTIEKPRIMNKLLTWSSQHNVFGLGRWGEHQHYNSDVVVELALKMAEAL